MDIVSRLLAIKNPYGPGPHTDCREAAVEISRLRRERDEARAAMAWRLWGDAPEDGREVAVYRPDAGVLVASFREDIHGDCAWFASCGEDLTGDLPTHWMPLPTPEATK
jgi:hypothetical protein